MTILNDFTKGDSLLNPWMDDWKKEGKKILGYFCTFIPEEIINAADILPVRIKAKGCTDTPMGDAYMSATTCSFTRCCLEMANRKQYDFLDGIISCNSCDQIRRLYDNIRYKTPFPNQYFLSVPSNVNDITIDYFKYELTKFKNYLEKTFNVDITEEKLKNSIKLYNKSRTLLKELYMLRKKKNPPITGTDIMNILLSGISMPRNQFNELLTTQLKEIEGKEGSLDYKSRIMLVGSMLDDPEYVKIIEDFGGLIVSDAVCIGTKYFWESVDENLDPLDALANRYLSRVSCPRMAGEQSKRVDFVLNLIKEFNVDGVIFQRMKFCPFWWAEIFVLRDELKKQGVPFLDLEREYFLSGAGAMKTRVQGFMEVLEAK